MSLPFRPHAPAVRVGGSKLTDEESIGVRYIDLAYPEGVAIHPKYAHPSANYDVAVIGLKDPVVFSDFRRPICLPGRPSNDEEEYVSKLVRLTGNVVYS